MRTFSLFIIFILIFKINNAQEDLLKYYDDGGISTWKNAIFTGYLQYQLNLENNAKSEIKTDEEKFYGFALLKDVLILADDGQVSFYKVN